MGGRMRDTSGLFVVVESPYAGDVENNINYARNCLRDCFMRGEFPFASHLLYTQKGILDDNIKKERSKGILAGFAWGTKADLTAVYIDLGITTGMQQGISNAKEQGRKIVYRRIIWEK